MGRSLLVRLHSDGVWNGILQKLDVRYTRMKQDALWMMGRSKCTILGTKSCTHCITMLHMHAALRHDALPQCQPGSWLLSLGSRRLSR